MVADKSKFDKVLVDQPHYGDVNKSNVNLNSSSSDDSFKSKNGTEGRSEQSSVDDIDKNESGDDNHKIFNSTYLCSKLAAVNDYEIDEKTKKDERQPNHTILKTADNSVEWKYRSSSYKQNFDIMQWSDSKIENLSIEDLFAAKGMADESVLMRIRKYLVDYQELHGISREEYTFSTLIRVIGQATGRCLFALFYVVLNIAPAVFEIFLHIARFVLDKIADMKDTENVQQVIVKSALFSTQVLCIYICLVFIFGFIVWPVVRMAFGILAKIMFYD